MALAGPALMPEASSVRAPPPSIDQRESSTFEPLRLARTIDPDESRVTATSPEGPLPWPTPFGGRAEPGRLSWSRMPIVEPSRSGCHETSSTSPFAGKIALTQRLLDQHTVSCRAAVPTVALDPRGSGWKILAKP